MLCFSRVQRIPPDLLAFSVIVIDQSISLVKNWSLRSHPANFNHLNADVTGRLKLKKVEGSGTEIGELLEHSYCIVENRL